MLSSRYRLSLHRQIHSDIQEIAVWMYATPDDKAYLKTYLDVPAALVAAYKALSKPERNIINRTFIQLLLLSEGHYGID